MAVKKQVIDGKPAIVADMEGGFTKVVFDDGRVVILTPPKKGGKK